jgi:WD40 repeat protein
MRRIATALFLFMLALLSAAPISTGTDSAIGPAHERLDRYGDPLPEGALLRLGTIRLRTGRGAGSLIFSPDSRVLATVSGAAIELWEVATGRPIRRLTLSDRNNTAISGRNTAADADFSPDGTATVALYEDGAVHLWDARSGKKRWEQPGQTDRSHAILFAPDGHTFATTADDGTLTLRDTSSGAVLLALHLTDRRQWWTTPIAFSPDGNVLACGVGRDIRFFDLSRGVETRAIKRAHDDEITCIAFGPDGKTLFSSGAAFKHIGPQTGISLGQLRSFDVATQTKSREFFGDTPVNGGCVFAISRDGRTAVSRQFNTLMVWDVASGKSKLTIPSYWLPLAAAQKRLDNDWGFPDKGLAKGLALSHDGKVIACVATPLGNVLLWDVASGKQKPAFPEAHSAAVHGLACTADGSRIATCGADGTVRLWDAVDGKPLKTFVLSDFFPCRIETVAFSRDGKTLVAAGQDRKQGENMGFVRIWDAESGAIRREVEAGSDVSKVALSNDGSKLLIERNTTVDIKIGGNRGRMTSQQPVLMLVEVRSGAKRPLIKFKRPLKCLAYSPDGKTINTIEADGSFKAWNSSTGEMLRSCVARDAPTQTPPRNLGKRNFNDLYSAAVSADGTLAVVGAFGTQGATMWDLTKETQLGRLSVTDEVGSVQNVAISPDKQTIATGSWGAEWHAIRIWEAKTGRLLLSVSQPCGVGAMQFTPDNRRLITGMSDGTALVWEVPKS